mmetsp:Transcript_150709/g.281039  ORF Transcript_150709/g.281039 Transcript_150709/m.281039 type:complete len:350 (-) Transcript_150709:32-1081(-)
MDTGGAPLLPGLVAELHGHTLHAEICRAVLRYDPIKAVDSRALPHPELNINHPEAGTALHWAIANRLRDAALALLSCRQFVAVSAKVARDKSSALHFAAAEGLLEIVQALLSHPEFTAAMDSDIDGFTALHAAAYRGHVQCVNALLVSERFGKAVGVLGMFDVARPPRHWAAEAASLYDLRSALHMAAAAGHADICGAILEQHPLSCSADATNRIGATALHMAARAKHTATCQAILRHPEFTAVNASDTRGFTALHWAAQQACGDICQAILSREDFTNVDKRDLKGRSAMDISRELGHHEVTRMIVARMGMQGLKDLSEAREDFKREEQKLSPSGNVARGEAWLQEVYK